MPAQPTPPTRATPEHRKQVRGLALVTAIVLLAHWGLLHGLPLAVAAFQGRDATPAALVDRPFITRTIQLEAPEVPQPVARLPKVPVMQPLLAATGEPGQDAAPDQAEQAQKAIDTIANPDPVPAPASGQDVQLAAANTATAAVARLPDAQALQNYAFPGSVRLKYDVRIEYRGIPATFNGELLWLQDGKTYDARMEISLGLLGSIVQTSKGQLGVHGLEPTRFGDKRRSEVAAHFERNRGIVVFSANTPDAPLLPGAQDQLSMLMQLASMVGGAPNRFPEGVQIPFQSIGPRSSESWTFTVGTMETLTLPGGPMKALKLSRPPANEYAQRAEIWLAPDLGYMPVRIRLTEANGDIADQQWVATQKP
jgi:hypothetical protein